MTRSVLVVDDERLARAVLKGLLLDHPELQVVAEARTLDEAVAAVRAHDPDLIFLDIQLGATQSFALFDHVQVRGDVIFVTAYDEYALRAFEVNALDYLLKPVDPDRLDKALSRLAPIQPEPPPVAPSSEAEPDGALTHDDLVCVDQGPSMRFFRVRDIGHIDAADDYTEIVLTGGGGTVVSTRSLTDWEARLPGGFLRVHRSHVVNADHVASVRPSGSSYRVILSDESEIPMSRRRAATLLDRLGV